MNSSDIFLQVEEEFSSLVCIADFLNKFEPSNMNKGNSLDQTLIFEGNKPPSGVAPIEFSIVLLSDACNLRRLS